jgi:membrane protein implicated in regulation of membrane protease activity
MTWADFYLVCFAAGFAFSFLSFLSGGLKLHIPHLPHGGWHPPLAGGHADPPVGGHLPAAGGHASSAVRVTTQMSPFNFFTLAAFLAWFGGTGFLLTRYSTVWFVFGLLPATLAGLAGATIVFLFLSRFLLSRERPMDQADYEMVGVLGRISSSIREGGTGEIIYSQAGTRHTCGARSDDGTAMAKGEEVVVTRYEKGLAYVRRWEEMTGEEPASSESAHNA